MSSACLKSSSSTFLRRALHPQTKCCNWEKPNSPRFIPSTIKCRWCLQGLNSTRMKTFKGSTSPSRTWWSTALLTSQCFLSTILKRSRRKHRKRCFSMRWTSPILRGRSRRHLCSSTIAIRHSTVLGSSDSRRSPSQRIQSPCSQTSLMNSFLLSRSQPMNPLPTTTISLLISLNPTTTRTVQVSQFHIILY